MKPAAEWSGFFGKKKRLAIAYSYMPTSIGYCVSVPDNGCFAIHCSATSRVGTPRLEMWTGHR